MMLFIVVLNMLILMTSNTTAYNLQTHLTEDLVTSMLCNLNYLHQKTNYLGLST